MTKSKTWEEEFEKLCHNFLTLLYTNADKINRKEAEGTKQFLEILQNFIASQIEKTRREAEERVIEPEEVTPRVVNKIVKKFTERCDHQDKFFARELGREEYKRGFKAGLQRAIEILEDPNNVQYKQWLENLKKELEK